MKIYKLKRSIVQYYKIFKWRFQNIFVSFGTELEPDVSIGKYTNINAPSYIGDCTIGRFCALAGRLIIRSSNHAPGYLNMNMTVQRSIIQSKVAVAGIRNKKVTIGDGVWIGDSVVILPNVSIGDGAVIGAGSIVTRDIPAYCIAVGNPCRVISNRFSEDIQKMIEALGCWDWSATKMRKNKFLFECDLSKLSSHEFSRIIEKIS
jgi:virginiamycin A acetyltransferase